MGEWSFLYVCARVALCMCVSTPLSRREDPQTYLIVAQTYDVRYASFSVYDLNLPGPVLRTVADDEFRAFYHKRYPAEQWEVSFGRNISLVVAKDEEVLKRCQVDNSESFVVELNKQEPLTDWFGVVYREVLPQDLATAADSSSPSPFAHYHESIYDAKKAICLSRKDTTASTALGLDADDQIEYVKCE